MDLKRQINMHLCLSMFRLSVSKIFDNLSLSSLYLFKLFLLQIYMDMKRHNNNNDDELLGMRII
jgi:hypothetical protein